MMQPRFFRQPTSFPPDSYQPEQEGPDESRLSRRYEMVMVTNNAMKQHRGPAIALIATCMLLYFF